MTCSVPGLPYRPWLFYEQSYEEERPWRRLVPTTISTTLAFAGRSVPYAYDTRNVRTCDCACACRSWYTLRILIQRVLVSLPSNLLNIKATVREKLYIRKLEHSFHMTNNDLIQLWEREKEDIYLRLTNCRDCSLPYNQANGQIDISLQH